MDRDETFTHTHTRIQTQTCYHSVTTTTTFLSPHNRRTYLQITLQPTLIWPFRSSATNTRRRHGTHAGKQRRVKALRCRSRSRRLTPSADTSSPAAVKGFQEVTLLLAGSVRPAGGQTPSWAKHTFKPRSASTNKPGAKLTFSEDLGVRSAYCFSKPRVYGAAPLARSLHFTKTTREPRRRCEWLTESTTVEHGKLKCQITLAIQLPERAVLGGRCENAT